VPEADALLALAADLERRDDEVAAALAQVLALDRSAEGIGLRAAQLRDRLEAAPAERAALERSDAEAREARQRAIALVSDVERELADVSSRRRRDADARVAAERSLERAREAGAESAARVARLAAERSDLDAAEADGRSEARELAAAARKAAALIDQLPRVSETGRHAPGDDLEQLTDWASRVRAALFVVRGQLEGERDRLVREANELGGAVLGEELAGASVALVRTKLEEALGP
jgi:hypothetical protein